MMIFKSIIYTKPYSIEGFGTYMQEKAQVEIILEEGDTVQSAFIEAERQLDEWHEGRKIKINYMAPTQESYNGGKLSATILDEVGKWPSPSPKEINLAEERKAIDEENKRIELHIQNSTTKDQLKEVKDIIPSHLVKMYMEKLREL